jgi:hypothetical protein
MSSSRSITREIGTAFAVLAIYLLTILAPLHQARASQLAFEQLGYSTLQTGWVLCSSADATGEDRDVTVAKCPAAGIGKNDLAEPSRDVVPLALDRAVLVAPRLAAAPAFTPAPSVPPRGSRAPPALV